MKHYRESFPDATACPPENALHGGAHGPMAKAKPRVGFGLMGEQGAESIHANFNSIERSYKSIPNKVEQLCCVMHIHHLCTAPVNVALQPPAKRYKKKEEVCPIM